MTFKNFAINLALSVLITIALFIGLACKSYLLFVVVPLLILYFSLLAYNLVPVKFYRIDNVINDISHLLNHQDNYSAYTIEFDTMADLIAADVSVGSHVKTNGFYTFGDNGGAEYLITNTVESINNFTSFHLNNGLCAVMQVKNNTIYLYYM